MFYVLIIGIIIITSYAQIFSFLGKISLISHALLFLVIAVYYIFDRQYLTKQLDDLFRQIYKLSLFEKAIFVISLFYCLLITSDVPKDIDDYLYHIQSVKWSVEYTVVPGLANLHSRLGFNSSWLVLAAFYSFSFIKTGFLSHALNGCFIFIFICKCLIKFFKTSSKKFYYYSLIMFMFLVPIITAFASSFSTDIPIIIFVLLINIELFDCFIQSKTICSEESNYHLIYLLAIILFSLTVKLSTFFFVCSLVFYLFSRFKSKVWQFLIILSFIYLPFLLRNIIVTGYLLYPFEKIDLFQVDWKVPKENVINERKWIYSWARIPHLDNNFVLSMSFFNWFEIWVKNQEIYDLLILTSIMLLLFSLIAKLPKINKRYILLLVINFLSLFFWFILAPDFRFAYGYIFSIFALFISSFENDIFRLKIDKKLMNIVLLFLIILKIIVNLNSSSQFLAKRLIYPKEFTSYKIRTVSLDGMIYSVPLEGEYFVGDADLPATPFLNKFLILRGNSIQDGFRVK